MAPAARVLPAVNTSKEPPPAPDAIARPAGVPPASPPSARRATTKAVLPPTATRPLRRSPGHRITRAAQTPKTREDTRNLKTPHPASTFFKVYAGCLVSVLIARAARKARPTASPDSAPRHLVSPPVPETPLCCLGTGQCLSH